jgi:hypothetical protein
VRSGPVEWQLRPHALAPRHHLAQPTPAKPAPVVPTPEPQQPQPQQPAEPPQAAPEAPPTPPVVDARDQSAPAPAVISGQVQTDLELDDTNAP